MYCVNHKISKFKKLKEKSLYILIYLSKRKKIKLWISKFSCNKCNFILWKYLFKYKKFIVNLFWIFQKHGSFSLLISELIYKMIDYVDAAFADKTHNLLLSTATRWRLCFFSSPIHFQSNVQINWKDNNGDILEWCPNWDERSFDFG